MARQRPKSAVFSAIVLTLLMVAPARAEWQEALSEQIRDEQDCKVAFISQVVERTVNGRHVIMAKVHCDDKRTFDALRGDDLELFEIKPCEKPGAESC